MSIAFSTIVILLLILPGFLYFRGYYSIDFSSKFFKTDFVKLIPLIIIPSIVLHLIFLIILKSSVFNYYPDIEYVGILMTSNDTKELKNIFSNISDNFFRISTVINYSNIYGYFFDRSSIW